MNQLIENIIEIVKIFKDNQKGNSIVILIRFSGVLEKAIKVLKIYRKGIIEKAIQDLGNNNNNNKDPNDASEDSESNNNRRRKRQATSPILLIGLKEKKAAKVIALKSPTYSY